MAIHESMRRGVAVGLVRAAGKLAAGGAVVLSAGAAFAQAQAPNVLRAPSPGRSPEPPTLWMVLFGLVIVSLVVAAALIPSRRGHQD